MRFKISKLFKIFSILVFLFCIYNLFPQSAKVELVKIYKQREADIKFLYSSQIKIVQELRTCFIAYIKSGFSSNLSHAGFKFECLDEDAKGKKYYLVYCPSREISYLKYYGNVKLIEENTALFWSDRKNAREILPAHFRIVRLPDEPLHAFKKRSLDSVETLSTKVKLPSEYETNPVILEIVNKVSKDNLTNYIQNLQDFQTRFTSTLNCEMAGDFIYDSFIQSGIETEYDSFSFASNYTSNNIIATLQGTVDPTQIVVICAHYDSVSDQPYTLAPGADDNASGTAAVMEASRILPDYAFDFSVKFICFSAEEWGLFGSKDYAQKARQEGEDIIAVINVDMIAYADFLPEDLDIICNPASEWLADRFFSTTILYTPLDIYKIVNSSFIWSDHSPFWNNGYSAICGIEDFNVPNPHYHTTHDNIDTLNFDFLTEAVKASLATVADLAQPVSTPSTPTGLTSRSQINSSLFSSIKTAYLSWDNNQDPVIGYNIYRTTTSRSSYQKLNNSPLTQTNYVDINLDPDTLYFYVVTALDSQYNESNYSKEVVDNEGNENANSKKERKHSRNRVHTHSMRRK